ncbi:YggS family pyridoxal phosphate-dependent enzyme [Planctomycetes bacterium K23_9]|uniref:Pyridoxal phosphate homeostasis protein n=1 Tax=Stieleria marina TaxID=1930275 RepID=A0A517NY74_9BACT|nr:Pyridoxal phosphate homeostasis protein [Planctomycetes bacterium K23_9]
MNESDRKERIRQNYLSVVDEVAVAAQASGRQPSDVTIVGVTKYVDAATTADLVDAGCGSLGENRPQVLWQKAESEELKDQPVQWHMIGHLQRNKLRRLMRYAPMIHSVDSRRLLEAVAKEAGEIDQAVDVLLEVNISGDDAKTGLSPDALLELLQEDRGPLVRIGGLMAMAGMGTDQGAARKQFADVRMLRDKLAASTGNPLANLSMGMSGDFKEAIAEGATLVRIGSRLFDGVL